MADTLEPISEPTVEQVTEQAMPGRPARSDRVARFKAKVLGKPLATERLVHERLGKPTALAVFASDNLSSSAYATEEILRVLLTAGLGVTAFSKVVPITIALLAVLAVLLFSYRQTIKAYPQAGGAYLVTRDNFGLLPAQVAGVALLTDYILTVSVSVAAGTAALTSLYGGLYPYRVVISVAFIFIIAMGNLRGVKESGRLFAIPTYFFILMMGVLITIGLYRIFTGTLPTHPHTFALDALVKKKGIVPPIGFLYVFLILKAFASGGAAVTGVEAISNGVPAFKQPEWINARTTLMWMGSLLGAMFLGLSILAAHMHLGVDPSQKVTLLAQAGKVVFGTQALGNALFGMLQVATLLILVLAANTSFADFPRLASFHAGDHFLPSQLTRHGDRLVFSNGIIILSVLAAMLVIIFKASVDALIPLYAIGVFTSFTFSQLGMAKHHIVKKEEGWRAGLAINGFGGIVSGVMTIIIAVVKFSHGAWVILITIPVMLFGLLRVNKHYKEVGADLRDPARRGPARDTPRQVCIIPVAEPGRADVYAAAYAARVFPRDVRVVHFAQWGAPLDSLINAWSSYGHTAEFLPKQGSIRDDIVKYVAEVRAEFGPETIINVVVPETVYRQGLRHFLHKFHVQRLKSALVQQSGVVVTNVVQHPGYEALEPVSGRELATHAMDGWRHVAVVLVSAVHNATVQSVRYARSLRPDELHCVHIAVDPDASKKVVSDWTEWGIPEPLEVLDSPYRQISQPIHDFVRAKLDEQPRTFVTIVIPEFVVQKLWHSAMHNQTSLTLKASFLFEPSVVVSSVPYKLTR
ncbi:MAG: APC family permease [Actinomycetota bacterium]